MAGVSIDQQLKRIEVGAFEIENQIVFNYFDRLPANERDEKLLKAIYIGVLALMEDRMSAFLAKTSNELGTELESLKLIFDMKKELFYKTAVKGILAEDEIASFLNEYFENKKMKDRAVLTGNSAGTIPKNKTGDIVCEINGDAELKIVIECKFDKSIKLGDIDSKDIFTRRSDTAWSQLIEAQANRDGRIALIVLDASLTDGSILKAYENVGYIRGIGFIAIINSQKGDYANLAIAYMLARDIAMNARVMELDQDLLMIMVNRLIKDLSSVLEIKSLVESNIENNKAILTQLGKSMLLMEFNQEYFSKFLKDGMLSKSDLLSFYQGEDIKDKYRQIEKEIDGM